MNSVHLMGRLVRDPELRFTTSGTAVASASMAISRKKSDGSEEVVYVDITVWDKKAEAFTSYLSKGSRVAINGRLVMDEWVSDGARRTKLKVTCDEWFFCEDKKSG